MYNKYNFIVILFIILKKEEQEAEFPLCPHFLK